MPFLKFGISNIQIFKKKAFKKIAIKPSIRVVHLWFANIDIQFILDSYVATTYCTSYMTKLDKSITSKLHFIIKKNAL
jgi:hypothetical protein